MFCLGSCIRHDQSFDDHLDDHGRRNTLLLDRALAQPGGTRGALATRMRQSTLKKSAEQEGLQRKGLLSQRHSRSASSCRSVCSPLGAEDYQYAANSSYAPAYRNNGQWVAPAYRYPLRPATALPPQLSRSQLSASRPATGGGSASRRGQPLFASGHY